jgi:zinc transporter, ZIP family
MVNSTLSNQNEIVDYNIKTFTAFMNSLFAGLSTGIGALIVFCLKDRSPTSPAIAFSLGLAAGVMITVSLVDVYVPNMFNATSWLLMFNYTSFLCFGVCAQIFLQQYLPEPDMMDITLSSTTTTSSNYHSNSKLDSLPSLDPMSPIQKYEKVQQRRKRLGFILAVTLAAHNFPEGLAVAISSLESQHFGFVMTLVIAMHNIPEGMVIAVPIFAATGSYWEAFKMSILSGLTEPLGALLALYFLRPFINEVTITYTLLFVGGVMISVSFHELIPEAQKCNRPKAMYSGICLGSILMGLTIVLSGE